MPSYTVTINAPKKGVVGVFELKSKVLRITLVSRRSRAENDDWAKVQMVECDA